jgi:hypothetical protein
MGGSPRVTAILLTCSDTTAQRRLGHREIGSALDPHVQRGLVFARELEKSSPSWVHRLGTDDRAVADIATEIIGLTGWTAE